MCFTAALLTTCFTTCFTAALLQVIVEITGKPPKRHSGPHAWSNRIDYHYSLMWGDFFFLKVTVEITGKPPHGAAVRTLELLDSSYVRVLADGVVLKVVVK